MQKWWLIGAGVVGVGLAVLLLGRPLDTGEDVGPVAGPGVELPDQGPGAQPGGLVRGADGGGDDAEPGTVRAGQPLTAPPAVRPAGMMVRPGAAEINPETLTPGANPLARRAAARRDTPEARYAARTTAPWTQIRREISKAAPSDPAAQELVGEVQSLLDELRVTQRNPQSVDFEDLRTQQDSVVSKVRSSPWYNDEIDRMLVLLEERGETYKTEVATGERVDPTE